MTSDLSTPTKSPFAMVQLGTWPTPLEPAPRLGTALGLLPDDLWIKRDDLTGLGAGGNKVRKLQYTCAAALDRLATTLVTTGAAQSNHARITAAAGARLGLDVILVLAGQAGGPKIGNLALDALFGATIEWAGLPADDRALERKAEDVVARLARFGTIAELIPLGGSSVEGAYGYVDCGHELLRQAPDLRHVVVALGTGGTMAGLVHSLGADPVLGVHVGAVSDPAIRVQRLGQQLAAADPRGRAGDGSAPLRIRLDHVGAGYSTLSDEVRWALRTAARTEGLALDPVYTGRALAGLRAAVAEGAIRPGERTIFMHTGGLPGLFGNTEAMEFVAG